MAAKSKSQSIQRMFLRGSKELGEATGFTDKRIHALWRDNGLPYYATSKTFLYDPEEVKTFLKKFYKAETIDPALLS